uniref:Relaxin 3 n=1 Tax=Crocodylus porosus TaxID=8502 RepID=A0A7M4E8Q2_CROPO
LLLKSFPSHSVGSWIQPSAPCNAIYLYEITFFKTDSTQTTNNKEPENLKLQSVFVPDLEQLQRGSLPLEQQAGKDLFNLYDYNEYVPTSDDFKEYVRQVEDAAQKNKGGTGIASPMGSNSFPWAKYPRKKRDLSMGVAGMCCKWGCTKMEISTLC